VLWFRRTMRGAGVRLRFAAHAPAA
jgi:hypothetical protein